MPPSAQALHNGPSSAYPQSVAAPSQALPWWRHPHMWMVVGGPLVVVVASFVTLWLAIRLPDPVVTGDHFRRTTGVAQKQTPVRADEPGSQHLPPQTGSAWTDGATMAPAQQARNHAATPVNPVKP